MTAADGDMARHLREQADFCAASGAPLYDVLLRAMADDITADGPTARVLEARWARDSVVSLRMLATLHRWVLAGEVSELAGYYRSVGGTLPPEGAWPVVREVLAARAAELQAELAIAPQTNEPGRALPLAHGLAAAVARRCSARVRLLEIGASAGLNLLVDRLPWSGPALGAAQIVERRGCDLAPIDPLTPAGRLRLESYVWPDNVERFSRLVQALDAAHRAGPGAAPVDQAPADAWLTEHLGQDADGGVLTVVWHSVMWQYLDDRTAAGVLGAIAEAGARHPLVHLRFEPPPVAADRFDLSLDGDVLGQGHPHGIPFSLRPARGGP